MRTLLIALVLGSMTCSLAYAENTPPGTPAAPMSQPNKMKKCNADAKGKHGDERREFMSKCLSKKGAN